MIKAYKRVIQVLQSIFLIAVLMISVCPAALAAETGPSEPYIGVAAGAQHSMLLRSDGTVWAWGRNNFGQLGNGTTTDATTPVQVSGLTNVKAIAACENQSFAVKTDGTVWAWGRNNYGQLGDGTKTDRSTPVQVPGLTGVTTIAAGPRQTFALIGDGTVWAWGINTYGQLGNGNTTNAITAERILSLTDVKAIATGGDPTYGDSHTLALKTDGTVWAWGTNSCGELGDGTTSNRSVPVNVPGLADVTAIAAGARNSFALKSDCTVRAWGDNSLGQLGTGSLSPASSASPVRTAFSNGYAILTDIKACGSHCFAQSSTGAIWGWGENGEGELGKGTDQAAFSSPAQIALMGVTALAAGNHHSLALKTGGFVYAWGDNSFGQLGNGTTTDRATPVQVTLPAAQAGQTTQTAQSGGLALTAQAGNGCIRLGWNGGDSSVIGYNLYRGTASGGESGVPETDFAIAASSYDDYKIQTGVTYYYVLKPVYQDGSEGAPSNEASAVAGSGGIVVLTIGSPLMSVDGVSKEIDPGQGTVPVIVDQRTFIPIRAVIEELGGTVGWDQAERKVTITLGSNTVKLWIGSTVISVNGEQGSMDVAPYVSDTNRTMLPVRFVTESLGLTVDWNSADQSVTIHSPNASSDGSQTDDTGSIVSGTASWAGSWSTEWGEMTLHQTGNSVSGSYVYSDESYYISGTASGNTLTGTFDEGNGYTGVFQFTMSADGQSFSGRWHYDSEPEWSGWSGTRE